MYMLPLQIECNTDNTKLINNGYEDQNCKQYLAEKEIYISINKTCDFALYHSRKLAL